MERVATARERRLGAGGIAELSAASGLPLGSFRAEHVEERIERALAAEGVATHAELAARMRRDKRARTRFRRAVAVPHSGLFRDQGQFEALERRVLPAMLEHTRRLRVWSAGCANGLELWSLAVLLRRLGVLDRAYLLGSDLLEENLAVAREGVHDVVGVPAGIRTRPRWEQRDLVRDPAPGGRWDLVLCRNVAIYLDAAAKARLHRTLAGVLPVGGVLMVGCSERLSEPAALGLRRIEPHIYQRPR
jgi:chemotaxis protein methyltransferase CheR